MYVGRPFTPALSPTRRGIVFSFPDAVGIFTFGTLTPEKLKRLMERQIAGRSRNPWNGLSSPRVDDGWAWSVAPRKVAV